MVDLLVELQAAWIGREAELLAMRLPDWRGPALTAAIASVLDVRRGELEGHVADVLDAFVAGLAERFAAIAACGIPDTLVHGDFHPGNVRGTPFRLTLLDWGDTGVGQPLLDLPAFLAPIPDGGTGVDPRPMDRGVAGAAAGRGPRAGGGAPRAGRRGPPGGRSTSGSSTGSSPWSAATTTPMRGSGSGGAPRSWRVSAGRARVK